MRKTWLTVGAAALAALVTVAGCEAEQQTATESNRQETAPETRKTVFDEQIRALDKAEAVEELNEERLKKLRDAEGGTDDDAGG